LKRHSPLAVLVLWVAAGGWLSTVGCQRVVGIHGSQVADAAADGAAGAGAGGDVVGGAAGTAIVGGASGTNGGTGGTGSGTAGNSNDGGHPGEGGGRAGVGEAGRSGSGGASSDAGAGSGGSATDGGGSGGSTAGSTGGVACSAPWHAENVPARLLMPPGMTACSVPPSAVPTLAAGVDAANFRGAQACGACIRVQAALGPTSVVVPIVELSTATGILLTKAAMDQIAPGASLTNVDWTLVACDVQNQPVHYLIKDGSNAGYVGIQIRNARYPLSKVVAIGTHTSVPLALQSYNYWESTSAGAGPLTLRLTDINGQTFDDAGIKVVPLTETVGQGQFPICR